MPRGHPTPIEQRFWSKVDRRGPAECWPWTGAKTGAGYGQIVEGGPSQRMFSAHRLMHEWEIGPIPGDFQVDHLCMNKWCVNPAHLEAVSARENGRRAGVALNRGSARTECPHGHAYDESNTYVYTDRDGYSHRQCRTCVATAARRLSQAQRKGQPWERAEDPVAAKAAYFKNLGRQSWAARRAKRS